MGLLIKSLLPNAEIGDDGDIGTGNKGGGGIGADCCGDGVRMNLRSSGKCVTFQYSLLPMLLGNDTSDGDGDIPVDIILKSVATVIVGSGIIAASIGTLGGVIGVAGSLDAAGDALIACTVFMSLYSGPSSFVKSSNDDETLAILYGYTSSISLLL